MPSGRRVSSRGCAELVLHPWQLVAAGETSGSARRSCQPRWIPSRARRVQGCLYCGPGGCRRDAPGATCALAVCVARPTGTSSSRAPRALEDRAPAQGDLPGEVGDRRPEVAFTARVGAEIEEVVPAAELVLVVVRRRAAEGDEGGAGVALAPAQHERCERPARWGRPAPGRSAPSSCRGRGSRTCPGTASVAARSSPSSPADRCHAPRPRRGDRRCPAPTRCSPGAGSRATAGTRFDPPGSVLNPSKSLATRRSAQGGSAGSVQQRKSAWLDGERGSAGIPQARALRSSTCRLHRPAPAASGSPPAPGRVAVAVVEGLTSPGKFPARSRPCRDVPEHPRR